MPHITCLVQRIVQLAHHPGGFDIYRILVAKGTFLYAEYETEIFDMFWKLAERETCGGALVEVVQLESTEIAYQNVAWKLVLLEAGKIVQGLFFRAGEVPTRTLLLDEEYTLPE